MAKLFDLSIFYYMEEIFNSEIKIDDILKKEVIRQVKKAEPQELDKIKREIEDNHYGMLSDEMACFYLLALKLKDLFLDCDAVFQEELCYALLTNDISPLNYINYARLFLTPPLSDAIKSLIKTSMNHSYIDMFNILLNINGILDIDETEYNILVKKIYNLGDIEFYLVFSPNESILEIYQKLLNKMYKHNEKYLTFTPQDFNAINRLMDYSQYETQTQEEILKHLLDIQEKYNDELTIIRKILEYLKKTIAIDFARIRRENNHDNN